ncbi:MAG TPA: hypothetical protein VGM54_04690 [Chthoniobacter sp.]|jgi:hypothetical protein
MDMIDDISLLLEFLGRCRPEVEGHGLDELTAERRALIERFIAGQCNDVERRQLSEFLQLHPAWIGWIADRVHMARESADAAPGNASSDRHLSA